MTIRKVSELLKELEDCLKEHGDLDLNFEYDDDCRTVCSSFCEAFVTNDKKEFRIDLDVCDDQK